jgi:hypothetical protein
MKWITEIESREFHEKGNFVGMMTPTRETKFCGFKVYEYNGRYGALLIDGNEDFIGGGEEITKEQIAMYVD